MRIWPAKTLFAILWFAAAMAAIDYIPAFEQFHTLRFETLASVFEFHRSASDTAADADDASGQLIDRAHSLDAFYRALARAEARAPGAVVRILHFGDSPITADQISGDIRGRLQARFGDGGEGFVLIAKPWAWYNHRGIDMSGSGWKIEAASQDPAADGLHGLGGASFTGRPPATARFRLPGAERRVELSYWAQPGGGSVEIDAGEQKLADVSTLSPAAASGFRVVPLPGGARDVRLTVTSGVVRLFGISFETDGPGVLYHSLGLNAAQIQTLLRHFEPNHWAEQIRHQRPDLIVLNYGTNESGYPSYIDGRYAADLRELVRRVRNAAPDTSILIMSPMDRGVRGAEGGIVTMSKLPKLVEIQRRIAAELDCAFFNTFQAMGGEGTMARWYEMRPRLAAADYMHLLPAGSKRVGTLAADALYQGYLKCKITRPGLK